MFLRNLSDSTRPEEIRRVSVNIEASAGVDMRQSDLMFEGTFGLNK